MVGILSCLHNVFGTGTGGPIILDEDNWDDMLEGEWMVKFYAPWCPACKALQPIWKEFAGWSADLGISIAQVDVTDSPGLSGRFMVTALPTVYHVKEGVFRQYRGPRDKDSLLSFVEEKKWQEVEEVPAWKSPGSYQMAVVSQFFKLSMSLRSVHTTLVQEYGLPEWGSYVVFALATILTGALIGLLLVCVIDAVLPPQPAAARVLAQSVTDGEEDLRDTEDGGEDEEPSQPEDEASQDEDEQPSQEEQASQDEEQASQDEEQASQDEEQASQEEQEKAASSQEEASSQGEDNASLSQPEEAGPASGTRRRRTRRAD